MPQPNPTRPWKPLTKTWTDQLYSDQISVCTHLTGSNFLIYIVDLRLHCRHAPTSTSSACCFMCTINFYIIKSVELWNHQHHRFIASPTIYLCCLNCTVWYAWLLLPSHKQWCITYNLYLLPQLYCPICLSFAVIHFITNSLLHLDCQFMPHPMNSDVSATITSISYMQYSVARMGDYHISICMLR